MIIKLSFVQNLGRQYMNIQATWHVMITMCLVQAEAQILNSQFFRTDKTGLISNFIELSLAY